MSEDDKVDKNQDQPQATDESHPDCTLMNSSKLQVDHKISS